MQKPPFEPNREIPLDYLSCKVAFSVAITSVRCILRAGTSLKKSHISCLKCRLVLHPKPSFLPKMVPGFYLNENQILPCLCPTPPKQPKEITLHAWMWSEPSESTLKLQLLSGIQSFYSFYSQDLARDSLF